jgi:hypothetical protein
LTSSNDHEEVAMNRIHPIRRLAGIMTGLAGALLALTAASPAALATPTPPPGQLPRFLPCSPTCANGLHTVTPAHIHAAVTGGMPGWQITLIAIGVAVIAAAVAVIVDRAWAARRHLPARTA